ncbi:MAG: nuclease [Gemmatimonadetes bacterium]|nr:nuclease [Gemmatimonadota bacterium]MBT8403805.1 nuclease [Gemmatimonadota bacterium]NNK62782.1 nuclease [Gemmatimonadota bacterium]
MADTLANPELREAVRADVENRPGVYRMWGPGDELLYVGKSIRVRTRLLSYFRAPRGEKPGDLIRETARIDWDYVPDEFGALVREMRLIQRHRPKYNVQHKRKRAYAFVKITREPAPRVVPAAQVVDDGSTYYGPFPRVGHVAHTIRDISHVLGLRDCPGSTPVVFDDQLDVFDGRETLERSPACLRADLGTCLAPCCGRPRARDYAERVRQARRFLEGRGHAPLTILSERMADAAARRDFEYAALVRDRLERLRRFQEELTGFRGEVDALSFVYRVPGHRGDDRVHLIRGGRLRDTLPHPKSRAARERVAGRVDAVFGAFEPGPGGLSPHEAAEILLVARWFRLRPDELSRTRSPQDWLTAKRPSPTPASSLAPPPVPPLREAAHPPS